MGADLSVGGNVKNRSADQRSAPTCCTSLASFAYDLGRKSRSFAYDLGKHCTFSKNESYDIVLLIEDLEKWSQRPNRKPLVLRGARQVGKTTLIDEFGKLQFIGLTRMNINEKINEIINVQLMIINVQDKARSA